ncbi:MAG: SCO family protein [bacterium]
MINILIISLLIELALGSYTLYGQNIETSIYQRIGVEEHLGASVPPGDLTLIGSDGDTVTIGDITTRGLPVVIVFHYSRCPMLCSLVLTGLGKAVKSAGITPGKDYLIVSVSIDPTETIDKALAGENRYRSFLPEGSLPLGWRFFNAPQQSITELTKALGFQFFQDPETGEFAHPAVVIVLSSNGIISRYLYGIDFKPDDLKLAVLEAGEGKVGSVTDRLILYCYRWDPSKGGYVLWAGRIMRIGGGLTLLSIIVLLSVLWRKEVGRRNSVNRKPLFLAGGGK